jgi:GNAT superfamily N-acetyltransferase
MKCYINGREFQFEKRIRDNDLIRLSFMKLARETFCLDFEPWYQGGYWGDDFIPYVLLDGDRVIANVSVNIIHTQWQNSKKCYIQLGTVMTDPAYQGMGLSRWLMNTVLNEWRAHCDCIYLFANDRVLDFYPKFGFMKAQQYQHRLPMIKNDSVVRKLTMSCEQDKALLLKKYGESNPFSSLPMELNTGLLMFYCSQFMKENLYYIESCDAVVILEYEDSDLLCYDIYGGSQHSMEEILSSVALENTKTVVFGFTPKQSVGYEVVPLVEDDTTLFILAEKENLFAEHRIMFPLLSHA